MNKDKSDISIAQNHLFIGAAIGFLVSIFLSILYFHLIKVFKFPFSFYSGVGHMANVFLILFVGLVGGALFGLLSKRWDKSE